LIASDVVITPKAKPLEYRKAMKTLQRLTLAAIVCLIATVAKAQTTPATVRDLSSWKLTLPIDVDGKAHADEIVQPALGTFQHPDFFFVNQQQDGVVFRAPAGGSTTKGSKYPRSELREMSADGGKSIAWGTDDGELHTMKLSLAITATPRVKPHVVCAQIHDADDDLLMIRLEGSKLMIERNDLPNVLINKQYQVGTPLDIAIQAGKGRVRVQCNGEQSLDWKVSRSGCYFKAGCYTQSNPERGEAADAFGEVTIYRLSVAHSAADQAAD
jgi:poly(beta-D-mannuronate) lyase